MLVAVDRSGATPTAVLPAATAKVIGHVLAPVRSRDARLVTDAARPWPPCAAAPGVTHQALDCSASQRVRGDLHIQTTGSRHEPDKTFLRDYCGIARR